MNKDFLSQIRANLPHLLVVRVMLVGLVMVAAGCASHSVKMESAKRSSLSDHGDALLVGGMRGAENIYADQANRKIYVSDLSGTLYLLEGSNIKSLKITRKLVLGKSVWGIAEGLDGFLYVGVSQYDVDDVAEKGGALYKVSKDLNSFEKISEEIAGINGIAIDKKGDLYMAAGNLSMLFSDGEVYKFSYDKDRKQFDKGRIFIDNLGSANGMFYSDFHQALILSETFSSVSKIDVENKSLQPIFETSRMVDGFDDLCVDRKGRFWVSEPVGGLIKVYDPASQQLTRFEISGMGVGSSCRIIDEAGIEYILITEREVEEDNDGRGLFIISLESLESKFSND